MNLRGMESTGFGSLQPQRGADNYRLSTLDALAEYPNKKSVQKALNRPPRDYSALVTMLDLQQKMKKPAPDLEGRKKSPRVKTVRADAHSNRLDQSKSALAVLNASNEETSVGRQEVQSQKDQVDKAGARLTMQWSSSEDQVSQIMNKFQKLQSKVEALT